MSSYFVYIMASDSGTLYIGITNNVKRRVYEHKQHTVDGFSSKYDSHKLVYFEEYRSVDEALAREKQLKKWRREKKTALIRSVNPGWRYD